MNKNLSQSNDALQSIQNSSQNEIILYRPNDTISLNVRLENETVWLTQIQIAELFGVKQPAISKHISNIYSSGELSENGTYSILEYMGNDGRQKYITKYYNLDVILSVGYRVNSVNATRFRQWANKVLKEYLLRGYAVNQRVNQLEDKIVGTHGSCVREAVASIRSLSQLLSLSKYCRRVVDRRENGPERNDNFFHLNF